MTDHAKDEDVLMAAMRLLMRLAETGFPSNICLTAVHDRIRPTPAAVRSVIGALLAHGSTVDVSLCAMRALVSFSENGAYVNSLPASLSPCENYACELPDSSLLFFLQERCVCL
jgi:hypothetical protein